jgi:azurin/lysophospholipase L1-like esterase
MIRKALLLPVLLATGLSTHVEAETARYVRIELPGNNRILTLAEVEVMSGGKNIAPKGKATQSSVSNNAGPERALDGNKNPTFAAGGQTHTNEDGKSQWWELDFGKEGPIEAVAIWGRGEGFENRMDGFTLTLLDANRKPVFQKDGNVAPSTSVLFDLAAKKITYAGENGQEIAEVPADYRDSAPFAFQKGEHVAVLGNGLADRMQHDDWMETYIQGESRDLNLSFRNLSLTGDRVNKFPRSSGFTPLEQYLRFVEADVILAFFGYNESFDMKPEAYASELEKMVAKFRGLQPNGKSIPRIVLFSPIAHEDLGNPNLPNGSANNARLGAITEATRAAAQKAGVAYVDLFSASKALYAANDAPLTINGIHLNALGNKLVGEVIAEALTGKDITPSAGHDAIHEAVVDKNEKWHQRYRATDGNDIWGGRSTLTFVNGQTNAEVLQHELKMSDILTANRDKVVWARANGKDLKVDDSNVPAPVPVISNVGGGSASSSAQKEGNTTYLDGQEAIGKMHMPEGFEVQLFADEKSIPGFANPVQLQVDTKGRLWAACWNTYPKPEPLKEMNDALLILHDDNKDGKADRATEFARVANPLGFEFWNGGVIVTSQPDILFLRDTDGDDVADERYILFQGIGSEDTHHTANNLVYGPDGAIYWQSGIFLVHNHENPWSPSLQTGNSGMYRFDPRRYTIAFHAGNSPNPHGIAFDYWGYHYANDGTGGRSYQVVPQGNGFAMRELLKMEVRPVAADAIVSSPNFPEEMQQDFLVCNTIGYLGLKHYKLHRDGYTEDGRNDKVGEVWGTPSPMWPKDGKPTSDFFYSDDKNFRPTDAVFGEDGALYIADWQNVIIGHMQHNVRDPNRDKKHGRIYRMVYKPRPLQAPVTIDGAPIAALLENLKSPIDGVRHRTRVELSERNTDEVMAEADKWVQQFDPKNPEHAHHLLEALWLHQQHNVRDEALLETVLASPVEHARIAAATVKHHWTVADPARGIQELEAEKEMEIVAGGIISDTPELTELRVNTVQEKMKYDVVLLTVKAGKKVKLTLANPDFMPHNLVITNPGKGTEMGNLAIAMGADGFAKQFIPESKEILHHTKLLNKGESETLEFTAPTTPGDYDYVCTFPGHTLLMRGILRVE